MLPLNEFDYGEELGLNARDAQELESDVSKFITGKTLFSPANQLRDLSQPSQMESLVGEYLQNGLDFEDLSTVKPGQEFWIHPMKGPSCSELFWPEDVERITSGLQKLFLKLTQRIKASPKGKRKHDSISETAFTAVNRSFMDNLSSFCTEKLLQDPQNEELPTPEQLGLSSSSCKNPSVTTAAPAVIDSTAQEGLPRLSVSSKLKRPRRKEKEDLALAAPPDFVTPRPDEDQSEHMFSPPLDQRPGFRKPQTPASKRSAQARRTQVNPITPPAKIRKPLPVTKQTPNMALGTDKTDKNTFEKPLRIEDQSSASSPKTNQDRESGANDDETNASSSAAQASHYTDKVQEEYEHIASDEQRQARASSFSTTQTILGDVEELITSFSPRAHIPQGAALGDHRKGYPPAPTVEDTEDSENMAPPTAPRQPSLDLDSLYRSPSCSPTEPHPANDSSGITQSGDPDHSNDQPDSNMSPTRGALNPRLSVVPESPGNANSPRLEFTPLEPSASEVGLGETLLPPMRVWILQSTQPRLTWSYCTNPGLLDGDIRSAIRHINHHIGMSELQAVNCQLNVGHERWSMDLVLDDGPGLADIQQVIRDVVRSTYFDGWQTHPNISMFLRPTETVACIRESNQG